MVWSVIGGNVDDCHRHLRPRHLRPRRFPPPRRQTRRRRSGQTTVLVL